MKVTEVNKAIWEHTVLKNMITRRCHFSLVYFPDQSCVPISDYQSWLFHRTYFNLYLFIYFWYLDRLVQFNFKSGLNEGLYFSMREKHASWANGKGRYINSCIIIIIIIIIIIKIIIIIIIIIIINVSCWPVKRKCKRPCLWFIFLIQW